MGRIGTILAMRRSDPVSRQEFTDAQAATIRNRAICSISTGAS